PGGPAQTEQSTVNAGADLALFVGGPANAPAGSTQSYTLTVTNNGPDTATGTRVDYSIPPGFVLSSTPAGCAVVGNTLRCTGGSLGAGFTRTVVVTGTVGVAGGSTITHTADVAATGGVEDGVDDNNTRSLSTSVGPGSSVSVGKTKSVADPVFTGDSFNFVLNPRYSRDFPVGAVVSDNMPAAFCYAGASTSFSSGSWSCTASSLCPAAAPVISCTHGGATGAAGANVSLGDITLPVRAIAPGS